jgi:hypothetical protein
MRDRAGTTRGGMRPDSLMARLARLQTGHQPTIRTRPRPTQRFFGIGLLVGGLMGAGAIFAMPYISMELERASAAPSPVAAAPARPTPTSALPEPARTSAEKVTRAAAAAPVPAPPPRESVARPAAVEPLGPPPPLTMNLTKSGRGTSPFPLQVSNIPDADTARVILSDMPKTARLTSGERRDDTTWSLKIAELPDLQVSLGEGTPEIFDITIEVASATGAQIIKTGARVRLKPADVAPGAPRRLPASIEDLLRESKATIPSLSAPGPVETPPFHTTVTEAPAEASPAAPPLTQAPSDLNAPNRAAELERKLPFEGLSSLGGPVNKPDAAAQTESQTDNRQLWWKLPAPSPTPAWAPFGNSGAQ